MRRARLAALVLVAALPGVAHAQTQPPRRYAGTLVRADAQHVVVKIGDRMTTLDMVAGWTVVVPRRVAAAAIRPGDFVASANRDIGPDAGRASELRILEPGYRPEFGSHPIGQPGMSMTHGVVTSAAATAQGRQLVIGLPGGTRRLIVPPDAPVTGYDVVARASARPGQAVDVVTRRGADGVERAARVILTADGAR